MNTIRSNVCDKFVHVSFPFILFTISIDEITIPNRLQPNKRLNKSVNVLSFGICLFWFQFSFWLCIFMSFDILATTFYLRLIVVHIRLPNISGNATNTINLHHSSHSFICKCKLNMLYKHTFLVSRFSVLGCRHSHLKIFSANTLQPDSVHISRLAFYIFLFHLICTIFCIRYVIVV